MLLAEEQIAELLQKAENADSTPLQDGLTIPGEIKRRQDRIAKLREAKEATEARAKERLVEEQAAYQEKLAARQAKEQSSGKKPPGKAPEPPAEGPRDKDQYNFTDPESRIMKVRGGFAFPEAHRKRLRTSNACENVNGQIKKRTRVVGLFPSEESLLRLVTGVLIEISESWETGKTYLTLS